MARASAGFGLLFDIDGTLAETDHLHMRAFNDTMARFGVCLDEPDYKRIVMGRMNAAIFADVLPRETVAVHEAVADEKEAAFRALAKGALQPSVGLLDLLAWADRLGVPCACVTNANRLNTEMMLSGLSLTHRFQAIVIADDLTHGKPHPLPYETGAARIGVAAQRCVAFEDSRSGVISAVAAGAATIGMTTGLDEATLLGAGARLAVRNFADPRVMALIETIRGI